MLPENCTFCGLCCTLIVRLSKRDIKRIALTGRKKEEFAVADNDRKPLLMRENGWCVFFKREGKVGICTVYENRPDNCRDFPGRNICDLAGNAIYRNMSDNEENRRIKLLLKNAPTPETAEEKIRKAQENAKNALNLP